jgi:fucose permease
VGVNALQADHTDSGEAMNRLHFFFGVGAIAGPLLATLVSQGGLSWRAAFAVTAALPALVGASLLFQDVPATAPAAAHPAAVLYRSRALWGAGLILGIYVGIETSMFGWIALYWQQRGAPAPPPALLASIFWSTLTAGRLLCGRLTDRIGLQRYVLYAAAAGAVVSVAWALAPLPPVTLACILLLGFALAGIYPTTMAFVAAAFPGHSGKVVAALSVCASAGGFLVPPGLGRAADAFGMGIFPSGMALLSLLLVGAAAVARR